MAIFDGEMTAAQHQDHAKVTTWLMVGLVMVLFQIVLGGITRLTGSGLSITEWDIVTGTLPPLNAAQWDEAFDMYKATPQYQKINAGMTISQFKLIYFWEYVHRLWARTMGFVFVLPFLFFMMRRSLSHATIRRLMVVVGLAALAAVFGWIMVKSGLKDRPWVSAYKLTVHLSLGTALFIYLFYTWLAERGIVRIYVTKGLKRLSGWLLGLGIVQLCFGGMLSGMKAALNYPTWPKMYGEWIPDIVLDGSHWNADNFLLYDKSGFMPALIQVLHRNTAYIIAVVGVVLSIRLFRLLGQKYHSIAYGLVGIIVVQIVLGIVTLVGSRGTIPVLYGVLHQGVGILLVTYLFYIYLKINVKNI